MGVAGIDAVKAMSQAVTEIAQLTDAPLAIDTSDPAAVSYTHLDVYKRQM